MPSEAQRGRYALPVARSALSRLPAASVVTRTPGQGLFLHTERAVLQSQAIRQSQYLHRIQRGKENLPAPLRQSVFILQEKSILNKWLVGIPPATTFIIEETYQGTPYIWGVTAAHYYWQNPTLLHPDYPAPISVSLEAKGNAGMTDLVAFPLPANLPGITPLKLADKLPQKGEELHSVGFFQQEFRHTLPQQVIDVTSQRFITTLPVEPGVNRAGACGSPILNASNEVVGVHIGSSTGRHIGYAVPASHLQRLLQAYHEGAAPQPLVLNGLKIGEIQVNDYISFIYVNQQEDNLYTINPHHHEASLDYAHLEQYVDLPYAASNGADHILFIIQRAPFSSSGKDKKMHAFKLTYDLNTQQATWEQDDSYVTYY